ncbi:MAG: hypothetical protein OXE99_07870 [Cellvibrionales bacterium]|nr:hypothetical protein [Cellvibrionales bacterium]
MFALLNAGTSALQTLQNSRLWLSSGLCLLSRPEALFFLIAAAVSFGLLSFRKWHSVRGFIFGWLIIITVLSVSLFAFRILYFDALFPQPVYAKSAGLSLEKIGFGFIYFAWSAQLSIIIFSLFAIVAGLCIFIGRLSIPINVQFILSVVLAYLAFIITSGGDWMNGGRFFSHIIPLMIGIFLFFTQRFKNKKWINAVLIALMISETAVFSLKLSSGIPWYQVNTIQPSINNRSLDHYHYTEIHNMINRKDIPLIEALQKAVDQQLAQNPDKVVNILSIQMGMPPYHLRKHYGDKVYFIDMRGLTTKHVTECHIFDSTPRNWFLGYPYSTLIISGQ